MRWGGAKDKDKAKGEDKGKDKANGGKLLPGKEAGAFYSVRKIAHASPQTHSDTASAAAAEVAEEVAAAEVASLRTVSATQTPPQHQQHQQHQTSLQPAAQVKKGIQTGQPSWSPALGLQPPTKTALPQASLRPQRQQ